MWTHEGLRPLLSLPLLPGQTRRGRAPWRPPEESLAFFPKAGLVRRAELRVCSVNESLGESWGPHAKGLLCPVPRESPSFQPGSVRPSGPVGRKAACPGSGGTSRPSSSAFQPLPTQRTPSNLLASLHSPGPIPALAPARLLRKLQETLGPGEYLKQHASS